MTDDTKERLPHQLRVALARIEELEAEIAKRDALAEDAHEYVLAQINQSLKARIEELEAEVGRLQKQIDRFCESSGF